MNKIKETLVESQQKFNSVRNVVKCPPLTENDDYIDYQNMSLSLST